MLQEIEGTSEDLVSALEKIKLRINDVLGGEEYAESSNFFEVKKLMSTLYRQTAKVKVSLFICVDLFRNVNEFLFREAMR